MNLLRLLARTLLGVLFLGSALLKLLSVGSFEAYLYTFGALPFDACAWAARGLIAAEWLLGAGLAAGWRFRRLRWVTLGVLTAFSLWLAGLLAAGVDGNCHCFGSYVSLDAGASLAKNALLLALLWGAWPAERPLFALPNRAALLFALLSAALAGFLFPPDQLLRHRRTVDDLIPEAVAPVAGELHLNEGRRMVCLYSVGCPHCRDAARYLHHLFRRHAIPAERMFLLFMDTEPDMTAAVEGFFAASGAAPVPWAPLEPRRLLGMCHGALPTLVLLDEGRVAAQYDLRTLDERAVARFFTQQPGACTR